MHLDSNGDPSKPVGLVPPNLRWLSGKAVFKVVRSAAVSADEFADEAQRQRAAAKMMADWGAPVARTVPAVVEVAYMSNMVA